MNSFEIDQVEIVFGTSDRLDRFLADGGHNSLLKENAAAARSSTRSRRRQNGEDYPELRLPENQASERCADRPPAGTALSKGHASREKRRFDAKLRSEVGQKKRPGRDLPAKRATGASC